MQLKPLYDRVLVRRIDGEGKTKGGIIIPDSAKEKPLEGEIVATGKGKILDNGEIRPMTVKTGDRVLFSKYAETEVKVENEMLLLLREDDLLGIIEQMNFPLQVEADIPASLSKVYSVSPISEAST